MKTRLVLGTAQWGYAYGITNRVGVPSDDEIRQMIDLARRSGIHHLDTARAYGDSENKIGRLASTDDGWHVVTKIDPRVTEASDPEDIRAAVNSSLDASRAALGRDVLDAVLLHRSDQRSDVVRVARRYLVEAKERGTIRAIGVSAGTPDDAFGWIEDPEIDMVQVAASILDQRLGRRGFFTAAAARSKIVHVRSVFLQGVALLAPAYVPDHLAQLRTGVEILNNVAAQMDTSAQALCLAYARNFAPAGVIIGCETEKQLDMNIAAWSERLSINAVERAAEQIPILPPDVVTPGRWSR